MMTRHLLVLFTCTVLLSACNDLVEEDLTGFGVVLRTPPDGHTTSANVVEFRWDAVPRAQRYRIQIATPDFANPVRYALDSLITAAVFSTSLTPGNYRWRVRAENPNSSTDYHERALTVQEATTLEGLTPLLVTPSSGAITASPSVSFAWEALNGAEDYRFELRSGGQSGDVVNAQIVAGTSLTLAAVDEGSYTWGIQGQNTTSASLFTYRTLTVDRTAPGAPLLLAPANAATVPNTTIAFQWQSGSNAGAGAVDSLFIDHVQQGSVRRLALSTSAHSDSLGIGEYEWYVRTIDAAGNGTSSATRTLTVE
jgi:hypothetical protein